MNHNRYIHLQPGLGIGGALVLAAISFVLGSTALAWAQPLPQPFAGGAPVCYATPDEGNTVFGSADAQAVQDAVTAVGAGSTIKLAGTCAGVSVQGEVSQTVYLTQALTLAGGYTVTNWAVAYPLTQPTVLDAQGQGRVILAGAPITLTDMTVQNGVSTADGGGLYATQLARLAGVTLYNNVASQNGGGAFFGSVAQISRTQFISNGAELLSGTGGGGAYFASSARIVASQFISNAAVHWGGGILAEATDITLDITGTQFVANGAEEGAGVLVFGHLYLTKTQFIGNVANFKYGAGLSSGIEAHVVDTLFLRNRHQGGYGAGATFLGNAFITRTLFFSNTGASMGGGAMFYARAEIVDTQFIGNEGDGAFFWLRYEHPVRVVNTVFADNRSALNDPAYIWADVWLVSQSAGTSASFEQVTWVNAQPHLAMRSEGVTVYVTNSLVAGYVAGFEAVEGTLTEDYNLFMNVDTPYAGNITSGGHSLTGTVTFANPAAGDYGLVGWSPAIDTGTNTGVTQDFEGDLRPQGAGYDIGYDEAPPTLPPFRLFAPWVGR